MAKRRRRRKNPARAHRASGKSRRRVRSHRRHRRSNPISVRNITSALVPAAIGGAGAIALDVGMAYLPLPAQLQTGWLNTAVKLAGALGLGMIVGKVMGREKGHLVSLGGLTVVLYGALRNALAPTLGGTVKGLSGLADFRDYRMSPEAAMGAYLPRGPLPGSGLGAYMNPGAFIGGGGGLRTKQLSAYMNQPMGGIYSEDM